MRITIILCIDNASSELVPSTDNYYSVKIIVLFIMHRCYLNIVCLECLDYLIVLL